MLISETGAIVSPHQQERSFITSFRNKLVSNLKLQASILVLALGFVSLSMAMDQDNLEQQNPSIMSDGALIRIQDIEYSKSIFIDSQKELTKFQISFKEKCSTGVLGDLLKLCNEIDTLNIEINLDKERFEQTGSSNKNLEEKIEEKKNRMEKLYLQKMKTLNNYELAQIVKHMDSELMRIGRNLEKASAALIKAGLIPEDVSADLQNLNEQMSKIRQMLPILDPADLVEDCFINILGYLTPTELCQINSVSKGWQAFTNRDIFWKAPFCEIFPEELGLPEKGMTWKVFYKNYSLEPKRVSSLICLYEAVNAVNIDTVGSNICLPQKDILCFTEDMCNFKLIRDLNLSKNKISHLPNCIQNMEEVYRLSLQENRIVKISDKIGQLANLQQLFLQENYLTFLPATMGMLNRLSYLNLSGNKFTEFPSVILNLTNLKHLNLDDNQITGIPDEICQLSSLEYLDLSSNRLSSIPSTLGQLTSLSNLRFQDNQILEFPVELCGLEKLKTLNFSMNIVSSLPDEVNQLSSLCSLDFSLNRLGSVPSTLGQLLLLSDLRLQGNQILDFPIELGNLSNLKYLNMGNNKLLFIPDEIEQLTLLEFFDLGSNRLCSLPATLSQLVKLKELRVYSNSKSLSYPREFITLLENVPNGFRLITQNLKNLRELMTQSVQNRIDQGEISIS